MRLDYRVIADWIRPEASVLDLGCGDGELLSILVKEKHVRANGIEIDEQAIYKCVERGLSVFHEDIEEGLSGYPGRVVRLRHHERQPPAGEEARHCLQGGAASGEEPDSGLPELQPLLNKASDALQREGARHSLAARTSGMTRRTFTSSASRTSGTTASFRSLRIEASAFLSKDRRVGLFPNLCAEQGLFLLSK